LNQILALSSQELQEEIRREIDSNPALDLDERQVCPTCGSSYNGRVCQRCLAENPAGMASRVNSERKSTSDEYADSNEDYYIPDETWSAGGRGGDEEFDPITIVAAEMSLSERILVDLSTVLDEEQMPIAEFLVGSLDERGYLSTSLESVAETFLTEVEAVEEVLKELQNVAPPGVGARDFKECLLIQVPSSRSRALRSRTSSG